LYYIDAMQIDRQFALFVSPGTDGKSDPPAHSIGLSSCRRWAQGISIKSSSIVYSTMAGCRTDQARPTERERAHPSGRGWPVYAGPDVIVDAMRCDAVWVPSAVASGLDGKRKRSAALPGVAVDCNVARRRPWQRLMGGLVWDGNGLAVDCSGL
jgi:hypothetical protein